MAIVQFTVKKTLAELSNTGTSSKRLTVTSWNGNPAKLDLRIWRIDEEEAKPGKGITLNDEEAETLADALNAYFAEE